MFNLPTPVDPSIEEGTVVQVDPIRAICKVKTMRGQILHHVTWVTPIGGSNRGADRFCPHMGDRVILSYGLGYPLILGSFSKLQLEEGSSPLVIHTGEQTPSTGNYSPEGNLVHGDQNKPRDMIHGDRLLSSIGGAFLGLLRLGTVVIRSSRVSEILLSKLQRLVRIVSSNWEHFTDMSSDVIRNFKGSAYRYSGYSKSLDQAKNEDYQLHFYYGNVATGELVKTTYNTISGAAVSPASTPILYKQQVTQRISGVVTEKMRYTTNDVGEEETWISDGNQFVRVVKTAGQISLRWNDETYLTIDSTKIQAHHKDGANIVMNSSGIVSTFQSGTVNMSSGSIEVTFGGSTGTFTSSSITLVNGGGTAVVQDSSTAIINGGHAVTVTPGGVAIS